MPIFIIPFQFCIGDPSNCSNTRMSNKQDSDLVDLENKLGIGIYKKGSPGNSTV